MRVKFSDSIESKALDRLSSIKGTVVLRSDLADLGSYRQISRTLNKLISQKKLVKIGTGLYAKAFVSRYSDIPLIEIGPESAFREALKRLNVDFLPGTAEMEYNTGKSTQVPVKSMVRLKSRCRRKIGYRNHKINFENNTNAK